MFSIYANAQNDRQYPACTGLNTQEFQNLLTVFKELYLPKKVNPINGKTPCLTDPGEALFFILYHLKCSPTFQVLGVCFGMSNHAAHKYVDYIMPYLKASLHQKGMLAERLFADQKSFDRAFGNIGDILIDGTEIPIQRAINPEVQEKDFSGKKNSIP